MVTETYPPEVNGVARTVQEMVEGLRRRGHTLRLARPRQAEDDRPYLDGNLHEWLGRGFAIPRYPQLKMGLPAKGALLQQWSEWPPDIVHVATEGPLGWSALGAAQALSIPLATDFHTNFHSYSRHYGAGWLARPVMAYLRHFHNRAGCTMVPTSELAEELTAAGIRGLRIVGRGVNSSCALVGVRPRTRRSRCASRVSRRRRTSRSSSRPSRRSAPCALMRAWCWWATTGRWRKDCAGATSATSSLAAW